MESLFIDVDCYQQMKSSEHVCGDSFKSQRIENEGRLVATLSDGLGSGVKANILASMTATMAVRFISADQDLLRSAEVIMDSLPVCQVRQISYATFSIIDCRYDGSLKIVEEGNPEYLLIRHGKTVMVPKKVLESTKWPNRKLLISEVKFQPEDRLVICSDGVTQAGMGGKVYKLGWRRSGLTDFVLKRINDVPDISSRQLSKEIVFEATRKEWPPFAKDDTSAVVFYFRHPRKLLLWTGPPYTQGNDAQYAQKFDAFPGKKILSGGTTANIVSRELGRKITTMVSKQSRDVPAASQMDGVDLVTEGVITLTMAVEYLEDGKRPSYENAAVSLAEMLLESDSIELMVGSSINQAHLDPTLPVDLDFRKNIVRRLVKILKEKYLKEVSVIYI